MAELGDGEIRALWNACLPWAEGQGENKDWEIPSKDLYNGCLRPLRDKAAYELKNELSHRIHGRKQLAVNVMYTPIYQKIV